MRWTQRKQKGRKYGKWKEKQRNILGTVTFHIDMKEMTLRNISTKTMPASNQLNVCSWLPNANLFRVLQIICKFAIFFSQCMI